MTKSQRDLETDCPASWPVQQLRCEDGGLAFPTVDAQGGHYKGMTLRDWFAGMSLMGRRSTGGFGYDSISRESYLDADAMLKARAKKGG